MLAAWLPDEFTASARGSSSAGTSAGNIERRAGHSNASPQPITNRIAKMTSSSTRPRVLMTVNATTATSTSACDSRTTRRRS